MLLMLLRASQRVDDLDHNNESTWAARPISALVLVNLEAALSSYHSAELAGQLHQIGSHRRLCAITPTLPTSLGSRSKHALGPTRGISGLAVLLPNHSSFYSRLHVPKPVRGAAASLIPRGAACIAASGLRCDSHQMVLDAKATRCPVFNVLISLLL